MSSTSSELRERVLCSLHIHLDHHNCVEVVVFRGDSHELQVQSERLLATRGVVQGTLHIVPEDLRGDEEAGRRRLIIAYRHRGHRSSTCRSQRGVRHARNAR